MNYSGSNTANWEPFVSYECDKLESYIDIQSMECFSTEHECDKLGYKSTELWGRLEQEALQGEFRLTLTEEWLDDDALVGDDYSNEYSDDCSDDDLSLDDADREVAIYSDVSNDEYEMQEDGQDEADEIASDDNDDDDDESMYSDEGVDDMYSDKDGMDSDGDDSMDSDNDNVSVCSDFSVDDMLSDLDTSVFRPVAMDLKKLYAQSVSVVH